MEKFCVSCEDVQTFETKKILIPVGREEFETQAEVCGNCGIYLETPEIRKSMDAWGSNFKSNFIDLQPLFTNVAHECLRKMADEYGIARATLVRIYTMFYLTVIVESQEHPGIGEFFSKRESFSHLASGTKHAISIPVRYELFRKIETYAALRGESPAKVIEEAILFCIAVRNFPDDKMILDVAARLENLMEIVAIAA